MGNLLTDQSLKPDPLKVKALAEMPKPTDKKAVERFNGFVNYISRFCPKLEHLLKPLTGIFGYDTQDKAFKEIVDMVTRAPVLKNNESKRTGTQQRSYHNI